MPKRSSRASGRITQILVDYPGNAVKFTERGTIRVEVSAEPVQNEDRVETA